jgi:hypothetical protein
MEHQNSKLQTPSSREAPNSKFQPWQVPRLVKPASIEEPFADGYPPNRFWDFGLGVFLELGAWDLELRPHTAPESLPSKPPALSSALA